jgi:hypothetical protein
VEEEVVTAAVATAALTHDHVIKALLIFLSFLLTGIGGGFWRWKKANDKLNEEQTKGISSIRTGLDKRYTAAVVDKKFEELRAEFRREIEDLKKFMLARCEDKNATCEQHFQRIEQVTDTKIQGLQQQLGSIRKEG